MLCKHKPGDRTRRSPLWKEAGLHKVYTNLIFDFYFGIKCYLELFSWTSPSLLTWLCKSTSGCESSGLTLWTPPLFLPSKHLSLENVRVFPISFNLSLSLSLSAFLYIAFSLLLCFTLLFFTPQSLCLSVQISLHLLSLHLDLYLPSPCLRPIHFLSGKSRLSPWSFLSLTSPSLPFSISSTFLLNPSLSMPWSGVALQLATRQSHNHLSMLIPSLFSPLLPLLLIALSLSLRSEATLAPPSQKRSWRLKQPQMVLRHTSSHSTTNVCVCVTERVWTAKRRPIRRERSAPLGHTSAPEEIFMTQRQ